jgi:hypothetical protein
VGILDTQIEGNILSAALLFLSVITALSIFLLRSKDGPEMNHDSAMPIPDP